MARKDVVLSLKSDSGEISIRTEIMYIMNRRQPLWLRYNGISLHFVNISPTSQSGMSYMWDNRTTCLYLIEGGTMIIIHNQLSIHTLLCKLRNTCAFLSEINCSKQKQELSETTRGRGLDGNISDPRHFVIASTF